MEGGAGYTSRCVVWCHVAETALGPASQPPHNHASLPVSVRRGGLSSRPRQDHLQIHIDPGNKFDYDSQLAALRGDVAKVKQVGASRRRSSAQAVSTCTRPCLQPALHRVRVAVMQLAYAINDEQKLQGAEINQLVSVPLVLTRGSESGLGVACSRGLWQPVTNNHSNVTTCWLLCVQEEYIDKAKLLLSQASRKLTIVTKQSRSWLMLYVLLFCIGLFAFVFVMNKLRTLGKLFFWR